MRPRFGLAGTMDKHVGRDGAVIDSLERTYHVAQKKVAEIRSEKKKKSNKNNTL